MAELATVQNDLASRPNEVVDVDADVTEAYERGKVDFNFFAALMVPNVMVSMFPPFYIAIFRMLSTRDPVHYGKILRFALGLPRGHAKTTFIKILIAWFIVYDKISFAVIICATMPLAQELLSDVSDMLGSENSEQVYGRWTEQLTTDSKEIKKGLFHNRNVILVARGADSAIRGINVKHRRPDLIFCDDAQTKECDDSPTDRLKFRKWLVAMFKIIAPLGNRLIIYVGNMYSDQCMLYQFKNNPHWISLITGAILDNGEPLWPELHSLEELMESFLHDEELGEADVWFAEVMNDPVSKATSLLHEALPDSPYENYTPDGVFLTIDPAGFRKASDDNVITVNYVYDGKGIVEEIDAGVKDPEQLIIRALQLALHHGASIIGVEDVAYQQTLLFWLEKYIKAWKITGIDVVPLKPKNRSKESRIRTFVAELYTTSFYLGKSAKALYVWQAMKYKIGQKENEDDILDAVAYSLDIRADYWHLIKNMKATGKWLVETEIVEDNTPF
ncbi:MAG: head assembly cofactor [Candidatus Babeliales bacterium]